jgi:hypothetical protein
LLCQISKSTKTLIHRVVQTRSRPPPVLEVLSKSPADQPPLFRRAAADFDITSDHDVVSKSFVTFLQREGEIDGLPHGDPRRTVRAGNKLITTLGTIPLEWMEEDKMDKHLSTFLVAAGENLHFELVVGHKTIAEFELPGYRKIQQQKGPKAGKIIMWKRLRSRKG